MKTKAEEVVKRTRYVVAVVEWRYDCPFERKAKTFARKEDAEFYASWLRVIKGKTATVTKIETASTVLPRKGTK